MYKHPFEFLSKLYVRLTGNFFSINNYYKNEYAEYEIILI